MEYGDPRPWELRAKTANRRILLETAQRSSAFAALAEDLVWFPAPQGGTELPVTPVQGVCTPSGLQRYPARAHIHAGRTVTHRRKITLKKTVEVRLSPHHCETVARVYGE